MKTERINVLNFRREKDKGVITGSDGKKYVFNLNEFAPTIINQLTRGAKVEFTVLDNESPSLIKDLKIIPSKTQNHGKETFRQDRYYGNKMANNRNNQSRKNNANQNQEEQPKPKYLPKDTREFVENGGEREISNYALMLNKYPLVQNDEFYFYRTESKYAKGIYNYTHSFPQINFQLLNKRKEKAIKGLGISTQSFVMEPEWRMVVGLGGASVYETSITLHHVYGIPYIPGSIIKGVTRSWIIINCFEGDEKKALEDRGVELIFGSNGQKGKVFFYDAFPIHKPKIVVDIMTPHYSDYYSKGNAPGDYGAPNPIPFITLEKTKFNFMFGIYGQDNVTIDQGYFKGKMVLDVVKEWLIKSLVEHGIGAKTAVGYGIMKM